MVRQFQNRTENYRACFRTVHREGEHRPIGLAVGLSPMRSDYSHAQRQPTLPPIRMRLRLCLHGGHPTWLDKDHACKLPHFIEAPDAAADHRSPTSEVSLLSLAHCSRVMTRKSTGKGRWSDAIRARGVRIACVFSTSIDWLTKT